MMTSVVREPVSLEATSVIWTPQVPNASSPRNSRDINSHPAVRAVAPPFRFSSVE